MTSPTTAVMTAVTIAATIISHQRNALLGLAGRSFSSLYVSMIIPRRITQLRWLQEKSSIQPVTTIIDQKLIAKGESEIRSVRISKIKRYNSMQSLASRYKSCIPSCSR
jgi:hypothetical protein